MEETRPQQSHPIKSTVSEASENQSSLDRSFQSCTNSFDFCVHFINKSDQSVDSQFVNAEDNLSLDECLTILQDKLKRAMTEVVFKKKIQGEALPITTTLSEVIQCPDDDLYCFYEGIKPIIKEVEKEIKYDTISKYSYLDQKKFVKVYIPLDDIGQLDPAKITSRFLDRSFEIKIHDYKGKNLIFAVPKTQCNVLVKTSKVVQKPHKLIVNLGKIAQSDNWFSLHKVKCIGEKDTD